ncbi:MAG: NADH-quinone oxidoreductase subunit N [Pseudomonadales bacterium]
MSAAELYVLLPVIVLSGTICVLLLAIAFARNFNVSVVISVLGLLTTLATIPLVLAAGPTQVTPLIRVDAFGLMFTGLILLACLAVSLLAFDYFRNRGELQDEFFVLLLSSALGGAILTMSTHFAAFILGLELLGVSLYAMISYPAKGLSSLEAALKYLILSGVSSAFILFGIALVFAITGTMDFATLKNFAGVEAPDQGYGLMLMAGFAMLLAGVMFKLSLVPFHMWTPDVYEGAPAPVTAFVATVSKGAIFAVLLRFMWTTRFYEYEAVLAGLSMVAIASMLVGNLLALLQDNVKRVLAYSSIAHLGYLLVALIAGGVTGGKELAVEASSVFLVAYFITTLGAFGVVSAMSHDELERDADMLVAYQGLVWRRPLLALVFSAMLLSLAGIPLTVGFIGKFYLFIAGVDSQMWVLIATLIVGSGIGLYYYLRIIFTMISRPGDVVTDGVSPLTSSWVVVTLTVVLVWLGVYPTPLIALITEMIDSLV